MILKFSVLNLTLDEAFWIEGPVEVFPLENEVHVSQSCPLHDFEGRCELHGLRDEEYPVEFIQVLHGRRRVRFDAGLGGPRVSREEDRHHAGHEVLVKIFCAELPLHQDNGWNIVPEQIKTTIKICMCSLILM
jgi:hypothetical protein